MDNVEVLENEILEETPPDILETPPAEVENLENIQEFPVDIPADDEMEIVGETETLPNDLEGTEEVLEGTEEGLEGDTQDELIEGSEEGLVEDTLSGNDLDIEKISAPVSYTANYITMAAEEEPNYFEWQKPFSEFTTSEMLLLCIFLLLLVEFVHKIFKGSHWFKY